MNRLLLSREQSRRVDALAISEYGIPGMVLMENAGRGVVEILLRKDETLTGADAPLVSILCGKGNNAGDGFVVARHLEIHGVRCHVLLLCHPSELRGDAQANYKILQHTNVRTIDLSQSEDLATELDAHSGTAVWLVDAMLGTGARGEPRAPFRTAIEWANRQSARRLALDVPSGLDCDSGAAAEVCFSADCTCTFVAAKQGFAQPTAEPYLGDLRVVSIGVPPRLILEVASGAGI